MQQINSTSNQLREYAAIHDSGHSGIAILLRNTANTLDEFYNTIEDLLIADERGRGINFEQHLNKLANLIDYQGESK